MASINEMFIYQKWPLYFCALLITMCPRRSRIEASTINKYDRDTKHTFIREGKSPIEESTRLPLKGESVVSYSNLEVSEPGFDFTDEEIQKLKIWPGGAIPYFIDDFSFDKVLRDKLRAFLDHTNSETGVYFTELSQPPDDDSRWVFFINRRGVLPCADLDFRKFNSTGVQKVVIGYDCMEPGNLAEIVLAVAGVPPQHNAPDRDKYVAVETKNIMPGKEQLFEKLSDTEWLFHEVEYDFTSAGHYGFHKYTVNGGATLRPLDVVDVRTGEATYYSFNDIWKLRMLYNYIAKNGRKGKDGTGCCSKLFKPGAKFRDFIPNEDDDDEVKPRPKPSKYTGIPEDKLPEPDEDDGDKDDERSNEKLNAYNNEENNLKKSDASEDKVDNNEQDAKGTKKLKSRGNKERKRKEKKGLYLSDIQTDK